MVSRDIDGGKRERRGVMRKLTELFEWIVHEEQARVGGHR